MWLNLRRTLWWNAPPTTQLEKDFLPYFKMLNYTVSNIPDKLDHQVDIGLYLKEATALHYSGESAFLASLWLHRLHIMADYNMI